MMRITPDYPKGDIRRLLAVLGAIRLLGSATLTDVAELTGLDRKTVNDLIGKAQTQLGVSIEKIESKYLICGWGFAIREDGADLALRGLDLCVKRT